MPLVVPGLTSNSGENDKTNNWMNQLMGKKIGDTSNETVRDYFPFDLYTSWLRTAVADQYRHLPKPISPRSTA